MGAAVMGVIVLLVTLIVVWRVEDYRQNFATPKAIAEEKEVAAWWRWAKSLPTPDAARIPSAIDTSQLIVSDGTVQINYHPEVSHESTQHAGSDAAWAGPKHRHAGGSVSAARGRRWSVGDHSAGRHRVEAAVR